MIFLQGYGNDVVVRSRKCSIVEPQETMAVSELSGRSLCKECLKMSFKILKFQEVISRKKSLLKQKSGQYHHKEIHGSKKSSIENDLITHLKRIQTDKVKSEGILGLSNDEKDNDVLDIEIKEFDSNVNTKCCPLCPFTTVCLANYRTHFKDIHNIDEIRGKLTCLKCKKQLKTKLDDLEIKFNFNCECQRYNNIVTTTSNTDVRTFETNKTKIDLSRWRHKRKSCFYCPAEFISMTDYILHIEVSHKDKDIKKMAEAIDRMSDIEEFKWFRNTSIEQDINVPEYSEQKATPDNRVESAMPMNRKCEFCPQSFSHFGILLRHYKSVHEDKEITQIKDSGLLLYISIISKLPDEMVMCEICGKEITKDRFKNHQNIHNPKAKECPTCKEMVLVNSWSSHKLKHLKGIRNFTCSQCGAKFNCPNVYRGHLRIHTKDREPRFQCQEPGCCSKFLWKKGLLRHVKKSHLKLDDDRNCKICGKRSANMSKHMLTHSSQKRFSCSICGHKTKRLDNIKTHMKRHSDIGEILVALETDINEVKGKEIPQQQNGLIYHRITL